MRLPRFSDAATAQAFWQDHNAQLQGKRTIFLVLCLCIFCLFAFLDNAVGAENAGMMFAVRIVATVFFLVGILTFVMRDCTADGRERALQLCATAASLSQIALILLAPDGAAMKYQFSLGVVMSVGGLLLVPRFETVARVIALTMTIYVLTIPWHTGNTVDTVTGTIYNVMIAFAVIVGSFERERLTRKQAIMSAALATSNAELTASRHEALLARDEAIAANKAKNRFLASVSHELRTPMNAILGFSGIIRSEMFGPLGTPKYAEYIEYIHSSGQLLQTNIDDLLDLARLETGKIGWIDERFALGESLDNALATCRNNAEAEGLSVTLSGRPEEFVVTADPTRVAQAVINLLTNAMKFSEKGQDIDVLVEGDADGGCLIHVIDTGCGMSPANLERVRMPFAQAHADSYSKGKGGLGLGLAIVSGIVKAMDGRLDLRSREGEGTTATLVIPAHRVAAAQSAAA